MIEEKLDNKQATTEKLQKGNKRTSLTFRDSAIDKITKQSTNFEGKRFKEFKFDVSKGTSLKGLLLRLSKNTEKKFFYNADLGPQCEEVFHDWTIPKYQM